MKKYLSEVEIRRIFSDPLALKKGMSLWKSSEQKGPLYSKSIKTDNVEPELNPEFIREIKRREKNTPIEIKNIDSLFVDE